jgi:ferredoxin
MNRVQLGSIADSMRSMQISIDGKACVGHGRCYDLAPDLIDDDDEGRGVAHEVAVPPELEASAREAVTNCPEGAVSISE